MPTSPFALSRERLKTIAEALPVLAGKCAVLAERALADIEAWRRYTPGDFLFLAVCENAFAPGGFDAPASVAVYLYAEAAADSDAVLDLLTTLRTEWMNAANYGTGELVCSDVSFETAVALIASPARPLLRVRVTCFFPAS